MKVIRHEKTENEHVLTIELCAHGKLPILKAAQKFTGTCYLKIDEATGDQIVISLRPKSGESKELYSEFLNELLEQDLRAQLLKKSEPIRQILIAQAFSKTNLIRPELDAADSRDDPLKIAAPDVPHP
jgi:His-Xaa-Ser system protein HxsD